MGDAQLRKGARHPIGGLLQTQYIFADCLQLSSRARRVHRRPMPTAQRASWKWAFRGQGGIVGEEPDARRAAWTAGLRNSTFGKYHPGDGNELLPAVHGIDFRPQPLPLACRGRVRTPGLRRARGLGFASTAMTRGIFSPAEAIATFRAGTSGAQSFPVKSATFLLDHCSQGSIDLIW